MFIIFDTETTGLPKNGAAPPSDLDNWPRLVQLAWQLHDNKGQLLSRGNHIVKPVGFTIPFNAEKVHGISTKRALEEGDDLEFVLNKFLDDVKRAEYLVGHNIPYDVNILESELIRSKNGNTILEHQTFDTSREAVDFCALPGGPGGRFKIPKLTELHDKLFGFVFEDAHDASFDVNATAKCFFELLKKEVSAIEGVVLEDLEYEEPKLEEANFAKAERKKGGLDVDEDAAKEITSDFVHLHVHSQYSVLQATPNLKALIAKAAGNGMKAVALTDLGNMFGAFKFVSECSKNEIKPIVGCEFFVAEERKKLKFTKDNPDRRFQLVLLAKNKTGYHNLVKLSSLAYMEGLYGLFPRIDKELVKQYSEGVIMLTGGLKSEVPNLILNVGEHQAEEAFLWYKEVFGEDFYVELIRHGLEEENHVNDILLDFARKHKVKVIAGNDVFYLNQEDHNAHDVMICIKEGEYQSTPIGRGKGYRIGLPNSEYFFKSQEEMKALFADIPESIENIAELVDKVEVYKLDRDVLLPVFDIPEEFRDSEDLKDGGKRGENAYLKYLTYEGAKKRYPEITAEIRHRLDFELDTIQNTGYPGYFLIVQDFTAKAREMGVSVGPGRGSAAGSAVAYCIGITNVDPIKYDLLFERFLNPDRVSLPDIDIDFDDEGRERVIKYVIDKYGFNQVSQIITYGTMAAKSSIRDCGRVMELPLGETNDLAKLVPDAPGTNLKKAFAAEPRLEELRKQVDLKGQVLKQAQVIEGSVRNTGTHACGVIIAPDDLTNYIPVSTSKDSEMLITQFDNSVIENAGMLKMDFLGLKTLTVIKTALRMIKKRHNVDIDIDSIPLDDPKTYELYQRGMTNGTFQFESPGMQKHLRSLKPDKFEDLIAMNALYRPGPIEYIPNFIARKHGHEPIQYDLPAMEEYLAETYGITVYQEQVMLLSQSLAGFSKGDADVLRKAMGKKIYALLEKLKPKFLEGCEKNGHDVKIAEKVWKDWEAFAAYAFNKSHSTCYSLVAYQTAYLKAHYPSEFMAAVLTNNQSNIEKVTFFMEECRNLGINVLGPHVNESGVYFEVNQNGDVRFGLGAIKGAGENGVESIILEREKNGLFKDVFDFAERINLKSVNKKTLEVLARSGAFDCFPEYHRRQYIEAENGDMTLIELLVKYAQHVKAEKESAQASLFGGESGTAIPKPTVKYVEPFGDLQQLNIEKDVVGLYISGHPLDNFELELQNFCNVKLSQLKDPKDLLGRPFRTAGIVTQALHLTTKNGKPYGRLTLEDYNSSYEFLFFGEDYLKYKPYMNSGWFLFVEGVVATHKWREDSIEPRVNAIALLNDVREKRTSQVGINLNLNMLNLEFVESIEALCAKFPGEKPITFKVGYSEDGKNIYSELISRKFKISPSNVFIKEIKQMEGVSMSLKFSKGA